MSPEGDKYQKRLLHRKRATFLLPPPHTGVHCGEGIPVHKTRPPTLRRNHTRRYGVRNNMAWDFIPLPVSFWTLLHRHGYHVSEESSAEHHSKLFQREALVLDVHWTESSQSFYLYHSRWSCEASSQGMGITVGAVSSAVQLNTINLSITISLPLPPPPSLFLSWSLST